MEGMYPELLYRAFIINAPKIFSILYSLLLPFLDERTKNKIQVFGHDSKQWKAAILEDVAPEELPVMYGGTKTDPDGNPNCITLASSFFFLTSKYVLCSCLIANLLIFTG
jgi:hypothetical protein